MKLKKTKFLNSGMVEADFVEADLSFSVFDNCDLTGTLFEMTNLENCDFSKAVNYSIDPEKNRIRKARFSLTGISGLLVKYDIDIEV